MVMPLPKMTKAHRMYLYGVLTTCFVAIVVALLTIAVMTVRPSTARGTDPEAVIRNTPHAPSSDLPPQPGTEIGNTLKSMPDLLDGWVKWGGGQIVVIETAHGDRTIHIPAGTPISLLNAAAVDPTKSVSITAEQIPSNALAHITLVHGSEDTAASLVIVKNHE